MTTIVRNIDRLENIVEKLKKREVLIQASEKGKIEINYKGGAIAIKFTVED